MAYSATTVLPADVWAATSTDSRRSCRYNTQRATQDGGGWKHERQVVPVVDAGDAGCTLICQVVPLLVLFDSVLDVVGCQRQC
jgi:hypothetical protein